MLYFNVNGLKLDIYIVYYKVHVLEYLHGNVKNQQLSNFVLLDLV